jgi:hypothetical protein
MGYLEELIREFGDQQLRVADIMDGDKVVIDRKTLTAYPLSDEDIELAEADVIHSTNCPVCEDL